MSFSYSGKTLNTFLDPLVLVATARSRTGASFAQLALLPHPRFQICLSVAVYAEWQAVLGQPEHLPPGADSDAVPGFLRYLVSLAHLQNIHFLWRPFLRGPDDDMMPECVVSAGCTDIVTHNITDFHHTEQLGVGPSPLPSFCTF